MIHLTRYSDLHPIWRPKSEKEFAQDMVAEWKKEAIEIETIFDDKVGLFFKTINYEIGPDWAGVLEFNLPELSTVTGGARHAMPIPRDRYKIMWVHLPTVTRRKTETYSANDIDALLKEGRIEETNGHETTPFRCHI